MQNSFPFSDLPHCERFRLLNAIDAHGGYVESYGRNDVQIALPAQWREFIATLAALGLVMVQGSRYCFPLGSDNPPEHMRHDANYSGSRAFWMFANFICPDYSPQ